MHDQWYQQLETNLITWGQAHPLIQAIIVVGSRARSQHPADQWSDLDLILLVDDKTPFIDDTTWLTQLGGPLWAKQLHTTQAGDQEWLVLYADAYKADYFFVQSPSAISTQHSRHSERSEESLAPNPPQTSPPQTPYTLNHLLQEPRFRTVFERGMRILLDKTNSDTTAVLPLPVTPPTIPTAAAFKTRIHDAFLHATRAAKMLRRGEQWRSWLFSQRELKSCLFQMLTWHTWAIQGVEHDTWHNGRFFEQWATPSNQQQFAHTFAPYQPDALWDALLATMALFEQLGQETAQQWQLAYPLDHSQQLRRWLQQTRTAA